MSSESPSPSPAVQAANGDELGPATLHGLLRLRQTVFVVEQSCPYPDIDGHDLLPTTRHLWVEDDGVPVATVRLRPEESGEATWVGRVCTAPAARGRGLGATLLREALRLSQGPLRLNAQERLAAWYAAFGFVATGPAFDDEGMPHIPMRLER